MPHGNQHTFLQLFYHRNDDIEHVQLLARNVRQIALSPENLKSTQDDLLEKIISKRELVLSADPFFLDWIRSDPKRVSLLFVSALAVTVFSWVVFMQKRNEEYNQWQEWEKGCAQKHGDLEIACSNYDEKDYYAIDFCKDILKNLCNYRPPLFFWLTFICSVLSLCFATNIGFIGLWAMMFNLMFLNSKMEQFFSDDEVGEIIGPCRDLDILSPSSMGLDQVAHLEANRESLKKMTVKDLIKQIRNCESVPENRERRVVRIV